MQKSYLGKSVFFIFMMMLVFPYRVYPVPASRAIRVLEQPGGLSFQARQWGDERVHGWETLDGYTIVFDTTLKSWTYASQDSDGCLKSTARRVRLDSLPDNLKKNMRPSRDVVSSAAPLYLPVTTASPLAKAPQMAPPTMGEAYMPVFLIQFNDTEGNHSPSEFQELLFGSTGSSMRDYFEEVSYGKFSVSQGPGGISGWYTSHRNHDYYGTNTPLEEDQYPGTLVREAVMAADQNNFDFSPYDMDGDCYVDVVSVVYEGIGEADGGVESDIWPHSWSLEGSEIYGHSNGGIYITDDVCAADSSQFVKVNAYILTPELAGDGELTTIGIMAHEYGHALGLPDLYDRDGSSYGIGAWSLMSYGVYNFNSRLGDCPAHLDAWSKYALGWVSPMLVSSTLDNETINYAAHYDDVYQLLAGSPEDYTGEYFLVENRQKEGFDSCLPGHGLLVWHIDEGSSSGNKNECYPGGPSCATQHYHVGLIQADGDWDLEMADNGGDSGDPFPGLDGITDLTDDTVPGLNLYDGTESDVSVTSIIETGLTVRATLDGWVDNEAPSVPLNVAALVSSNDITLSWDGSTDNRAVSGYRIYRDGSFIQSLSLLTYTDTVNQLGTYCYTVIAYDASGNESSESDPGCAQVTSAPYSLILTLPNGGEIVQKDELFTITWTSENAGNTMAIDLFKGGTDQAHFIQSITENTENTGEYVFTPATDLEAGDDYYIKLNAMDGFLSDVSDEPFSIVNTPGQTDSDGDGYTPDQGDCDDTNDTIHPYAAETCGDGVDQNCDGSDLECITGGNDIDDDEDGYTENLGDCDDGNGLIYPGAEDICGDGIDQDCSGADRNCNSDIFSMTTGETMVVDVSTGTITLYGYSGNTLHNHSFIYGPVDIIVTQVVIEGTVSLTIQLSSPFPNQGEVYMIINGNWFNVMPSCEFNDDRTELIVDLTDGGFGDTNSTGDRQINAVFGISIPTQTTPQEPISIEDGDGGGCFISSLTN